MRYTVLKILQFYVIITLTQHFKICFNTYLTITTKLKKKKVNDKIFLHLSSTQ